MLLCLSLCLLPCLFLDQMSQDAFTARLFDVAVWVGRIESTIRYQQYVQLPGDNDRMARLDLQDLLILKEVHRTGSITEAANRIGLSQPSTSIRLSELRKHFADPLFVRTSAGMKSTPRMDGLLPLVNNALDLLNPEHAGLVDFVPAESDRTFRVAFSGVGLMV